MHAVETHQHGAKLDLPLVKTVLHRTEGGFDLEKTDFTLAKSEMYAAKGRFCFAGRDLWRAKSDFPQVKGELQLYDCDLPIGDGMALAKQEMLPDFLIVGQCGESQAADQRGARRSIRLGNMVDQRFSAFIYGKNSPL